MHRRDALIFLFGFLGGVIAACVSFCSAPSAIAPTTSVSVPQEFPLSQPKSISVDSTFSFRRNHIATVSIIGEPDTLYCITIYYAGGPSRAKGLEPKTSDAQGRVTWRWMVGSGTLPGTFNMTITGGGVSVERDFVIR